MRKKEIGIRFSESGRERIREEKEVREEARGEVKEEVRKREVMEESEFYIFDGFICS